MSSATTRHNNQQYTSKQTTQSTSLSHSFGLTIQQFKDAMVLLFDHQVKMGTVTQHDPLFFPLFNQAKYPEGQIQYEAQPGFHWARSKVHRYRLNNIHLEESMIKNVLKSVTLKKRIIKSKIQL